jgi:hypothetical protein
MSIDSIALIVLESVVKNFLGELSLSIFEPKEKRELKEVINISLVKAMARLEKEYPNQEVVKLLLELQILEAPSIKDEIKSFFERPSDTNLSRAITAEIRRSGYKFYSEQVEETVNAFIRFFLEELIIRSPQVRERLSAFANLKFLENPLQPTIQGDYVMGNKFDISNSPIGILNTGEIRNVENISAHISMLKDSGHTEVAEALNKLTEAVKVNNEISGVQRAEILEQIEELSKQAALPKEKQSRPGVIKAIISSITGALGTAASLAQIWSVWGEPIKKFFGIG